MIRARIAFKYRVTIGNYRVPLQKFQFQFLQSIYLIHSIKIKRYARFATRSDFRKCFRFCLSVYGVFALILKLKSNLKSFGDGIVARIENFRVIRGLLFEMG